MAFFVCWQGLNFFNVNWQQRKLENFESRWMGFSPRQELGRSDVVVLRHPETVEEFVIPQIPGRTCVWFNSRQPNAPPLG